MNKITTMTTGSDMVEAITEQLLPKGNYQLTVSLDEWFLHTKTRGQRFSVMGLSHVKQIIEQHGWELEYFIEDLEGSPLIKRVWPLQDWLHHKAVNMVLVKETKLEVINEAREYHDSLMQWKLKVRQFYTGKECKSPKTLAEVNIILQSVEFPSTARDIERRDKVTARFPFTFKTFNKSEVKSKVEVIEEL